MAKKKAPINNYDAELDALSKKSAEDFVKYFKSSTICPVFNVKNGIIFLSIIRCEPIHNP